MNSRHLLAIALLAPTAAGCASIIRGTNDEFTIETTPPGAHAALSTGQECETTPCTLKLPRKNAFNVTLTMPGYQTTTHEIRNPWSRQGTTTGIVGNVILGGAIGIGVDAATGANRDFVPNPLQVSMIPEAQPAPAAAPEGAMPAEAAAPATEAAPATPPSQ
jgi:hypothetical protein